MRFNRPGRIDDVLFVIALLVPALFAGARYLESDRQMVEIVQAQSRGAVAADKVHESPSLRVARADRNGR